LNYRQSGWHAPVCNSTDPSLSSYLLDTTLANPSIPGKRVSAVIFIEPSSESPLSRTSALSSNFTICFSNALDQSTIFGCLASESNAVPAMLSINEVFKLRGSSRKSPCCTASRFSCRSGSIISARASRPSKLQPYDSKSCCRKSQARPDMAGIPQEGQLSGSQRRSRK